MRRFIISTILRNTKFNEPSGYWYIFDFENSKVIHRGPIIEPPFRDVDPNPRGGLRGGKGIAITDDQILLANAVCIFRFNHDWDLINVISHPSCANIHDILLDRENNLWVTSARNDILFKFNLEGGCLKFIYFREIDFIRNSHQFSQPVILSEEDIQNGSIDFRNPRTHIPSTHDGTHINSVCQLPDGSMLASLGLVVGRNFSVLMRIKDILSKIGLWAWVIRINHYIRNLFSLKKDIHSDLVIQPAKGKSIVAHLMPDNSIAPSLILENIHVPSHSILAKTDGTAIYLNTSIGELIHFNPKNASIYLSTKISDQFLRGVIEIDGHQILIGSQNNLLLFDLSTNEIKNVFSLSNVSEEAVFVIQEFPNNFSLPPKSFEAHLGKLVGFNGREVIFDKMLKNPR